MRNPIYSQLLCATREATIWVIACDWC